MIQNFHPLRTILFTVIAGLIISCGNKGDKTLIDNSLIADSLTNRTISVSFQEDDSAAIPLITIEDTIRYHFGIADSIELLSARYFGQNVHGEHARVFIDHNPNSVFHDEILESYGCECKDEKLYNSIYSELFQKYKDSIDVDHERYKEFFGHWMPIEKREDKFYLTTIVCEFNRHGFTLSDSALIEYNMDGLFPSLLLSIRQSESDLVIRTSDETYRLKRIDGVDEIYFHDAPYLNDGEYLVNSKYLNLYPVIVTDCHEVGAAD